MKCPYCKTELQPNLKDQEWCKTCSVFNTKSCDICQASQAHPNDMPSAYEPPNPEKPKEQWCSCEEPDKVLFESTTTEINPNTYMCRKCQKLIKPQPFSCELPEKIYPMSNTMELNQTELRNKLNWLIDCVQDNRKEIERRRK